MYFWDRKSLDNIRFRNKCTDEEWAIVSDFLISGKCTSLEDEIVCYKNMLNNESWYYDVLVNNISLEDSDKKFSISFLKDGILFPILMFIAVLFSNFVLKIGFYAFVTVEILDIVIHVHEIIVSRNNAKKLLAELFLPIKLQMEDTYVKDDSIILEISKYLDIIAQNKYHGFQTDVYELQKLAHQYAEVLKSKGILTLEEKNSLFKSLYALNIEEKVKDYQRQNKLNIEREKFLNTVDEKILSSIQDEPIIYDLESQISKPENGYSLSLTLKKGE